MWFLIKNDSFPLFFLGDSGYFSMDMEVYIDGAHAEKKQLKLGLVVKENRRRRK